ncbi:PREDICTED: disease resistance [Prunus dulcis]|uniref:PREDICTED: disease resistance n=2 Tax=Prunus dulcis TaxID=3755 RepID=A0A5E4EZ37_PRUDU|nr:disease resistance protein RPM1-like isoform X1 [Prunus dulcis]VVA21047.1 PREDICTED: disease resistance [Prunus dulcis]
MAKASVDIFIGKFVAILESEAASIAGVHDQVDEIKQELVFMKSFLADADEGNKVDTQVEEAWIGSIRDLANDVENIIDEFMYHIYVQHRGRRFARWLRKTIHFPKNLWYKRQIANKLQKIAVRIRAIHERNQRYGGRAAVEGKSTSEDIRRWVQTQAESSLYQKEDELVGIEGDKNMLMGWLMNKEEHQIVVSVVGMGGSGKTTLVARTFTNHVVKSHFECYAWITVSQSYVLEDLLIRLMTEFHKARKEEVPTNMNSMSRHELLEILVNYLETKRYLVVLDDVWDIHLWEKIRFSFPDTQLGSRIMITTRREDIASSSFRVESHVHKIRPLERSDAWVLFSKKAFSSYPNKSCSPELLPLAQELVERCGGLPLAIVALSGLMSSKKSLTEWSTVYNSLNWHLTNNPLLEPMKSILLFSYNDLPYRLKQCFLYCSLFPEDTVILNMRITRLWIAEGFVEHVKGVTPEEVANSYVMELIFRNMLQERYQEHNHACKMHDVMLEIALSIAEKEKFCSVHEGSETMEETGALRLSIQTTNGEIGYSCTGLSRLRSFLVFATGASSFSFSKTLLFDLTLLRVLDLEDVPIDNLPDEVTYLFNLKYLNLRGTPIKELPESIGQLRNLQTLNIMDTNIEALPRGISKLLNLRHLVMSHYQNLSQVIGVKIPSSISKMKKLQYLGCIKSEGNIIRLIGNMTQLKALGITNVKERDEEDLCASIQEMKVLSKLGLWVADGEDFLRVDALSSPPPFLDTLTLSGKLEKVPHWVCSLHSLIYLRMGGSRLEEEVLPHIEALPSLRLLCLDNSYVGKELCFSSGFVKLTYMALVNFSLVNKITIEEGVMPNLDFLIINTCLSLERLPLGIEHLTKLQGYTFESVSEQFTESIREGGVDHARMLLIDERCKKYAKKSYY